MNAAEQAPGTRPGTRIHSIHATAGELRFTVDQSQRPQEVWIRTSLPVVPEADVAVALTLLAAMTAPGPLRVDAPVDESLVQRLPEIQAVLRAWRMGGDRPTLDPYRYPVDVLSPLSAPPPRAPDRGAAVFFSCGVDSFSTLLRHPEITHLIYIAGMDVPVGEVYDDHHDAMREIVARVAERFAKRLITVETNVRQLYEGIASLAAATARLGAVARLVAPEIARVYMAADTSHEWKVDNRLEPITAHLWGTGRLEVIVDGAELRRTEKVAQIADHDVVRDSLRVCWAQPGSGRNCGRCEKCLRTMVALEALGKRNSCATFPPVLDLEAVAAARPVTRSDVCHWIENLELAIERAAPVELIEAIETCLANAERAARAAPRAPALVPNPERGTARMLYMSPRTRLELDGARAAVICVGSYDGSGNYGDIAQLQAALDMLGVLGEDVVALPVVELRWAERHAAQGLASTPGFAPDRVLFFATAEENPDWLAAERGLVPATLPAGLGYGATYFYGGGYLNERWGGRKLHMAQAAEALARTRVDAPDVLCSGLQIEPAWAGALGWPQRELLRRAQRVGVRDPLSLQAVEELADESGEPAATITGDDAVGLIARYRSEAKAGDNRAVLRVNLHACAEDWVSDDPDALVGYLSRFVAGLGKAADRPLEIQPLIAYDDDWVSELPVATQVLEAIRALGDTSSVRDPTVLRPAGLDAAAETMARAALTVSCSYHVALTSLMLALPTVLVRHNEYYAQKAHGLQRDFSLPPELLPSVGDDPAHAAAQVVKSTVAGPGAARFAAELERAGGRVAE
ncbi:MAG: polysaccharide pyruvyl transferase family protein, partial [Solirubrobacterales bacterium]